MLGGCFRPSVQEYRGDGTIQDTSDNGGFLPVRSYMITLPSFPLDKPYDHTFRLDHVPTILHAQVEIVLFVPNSFSQTRSANARSVIAYSLETTDGIHHERQKHARRANLVKPGCSSSL